MNDLEYCNEKYTMLYSEYRKMLKEMVAVENKEELETMPVVDLMQLAKQQYPTKEKAITRASALFIQEANLANLEELLYLFKYIKE